MDNSVTEARWLLGIPFAIVIMVIGLAAVASTSADSDAPARTVAAPVVKTA